MDVVQAAWRSLGRPIPAGLGFSSAGRCARCDTAGPVVRADQVLSDKWTGWGSWLTADRPQLCMACAWAYRDPRHRRGALLVTRTPTARRLDPAGLAAQLSVALPVDHAVALPLRANRKHVLPVAVWGAVTVDDVPVPWSARDAHRFTVTRKLRGWGFGSATLGCTVPDYRVLRRLPAGERLQVLALWPVLDPWRPVSPWLAAASLAAGLQLAAA